MSEVCAEASIEDSRGGRSGFGVSAGIGAVPEVLFAALGNHAHFAGKMSGLVAGRK
jgi:hypothetical protein